MTETQKLLRHFLAVLAYRTQKSLRAAPDGFADFQAGHDVRTPHEILRHMTGVLGYARTFYLGGEWWPNPLPTMDNEIARFHAILEEVAGYLDEDKPLQRFTHERMLQGPFSDAMTHVGQLAMLRRMFGSPVRGENFVKAAINPKNLGPDQPDPVSPDDQ